MLFPTVGLRIRETYLANSAASRRTYKPKDSCMAGNNQKYVVSSSRQLAHQLINGEKKYGVPTHFNIIQS